MDQRADSMGKADEVWTPGFFHSADRKLACYLLHNIARIMFYDKKEVSIMYMEDELRMMARLMLLAAIVLIGYIVAG